MLFISAKVSSRWGIFTKLSLARRKVLYDDVRWRAFTCAVCHALDAPPPGSLDRSSTKRSVLMNVEDKAGLEKKKGVGVF